MRILVIQTAFIGDVVLTTPLIAALGTRWPGAEIHVVSTPQGCSVLQNLPNVHCHSLDKKGQSLRVGLKKVRENLGAFEPFDLVFCVHRSLRSLWLGKSIDAEVKIAFQSFWSKLLGYKTIPYPAYEESLHYGEKTLTLLKALDSTSSGHSRKPVLAVSKQESNSAQEKLRELSGKPYFVVSPFSVWGTKTWFADRFARLSAKLCRQYHIPVVLIGAGAGREQVTAGTIEEKIKAEGGQVLNLVNQTNLGELKAIIQNAKFLIANDSAPVHMASAFNVPTVAVFGPTVKKWGFFPLSEKSVVVERSGLDCRPCHIHGPQRCPKGHFKCMDEIQVEDVAAAVESLKLG